MNQTIQLPLTLDFHYVLRVTLLLSHKYRMKTC